MDNEDILARVNSVKHNVPELMLTTIDLMFDACLGLIYEDYLKIVEDIEERERLGVAGGVLKAHASITLQANVSLINYLKEKVVKMYKEVLREPQT